MTILVIDTATEACSVALLRDGAVLAENHAEVGRGHAERLVPMIGALLAEAGVTRAETVWVDCGPGSFTGIRVGLAAARALGYAWNAPVRGYSSTAVLAVGQGDGPSTAVAITGGHGEVFVQRYAALPFTALTALVSLPPAKAAGIIKEDRIVGSGAVAVVAARGAGRAIAANPRAVDTRLLPPAFVDLPPVPLYGRPPDAKRPAP